MSRKFELVIVTIMALTVVSQAQDDTIDEDALFADTNIVADSSEYLDPSLNARTESTIVGFSGEINSAVQAGSPKENFKDFSLRKIHTSAYILGNLMLDVRLPMDIKAFANTEAQYIADSSVVHFNLQEFFLDANINRKVYFRTGKQVLQWGRGYVWNPTDLINVEKKSFIPKVGYREGAFGLKMHIPFGAKYNIYSFIDMRNFTSVDSIAAAFKAEMLLGGTEISAAVWGKKNKDPVFGIDFSTAILNCNLYGEMSLESGKNISVVDLSGISEDQSLYDFLVESMRSGKPLDETTINKKVVPRLTIGINRYFDFMNVQDRISVMSEFYYNKAGADGNFFEKYQMKATIDSLKKAAVSNPNDTMKVLSEKFQARFSDPNNFSKYYIALIAVINKFIVSDLTFSARGIMDIEQRAGILNAELSYKTLHNLSMGLLVSGVVGSPESAYALFMDAMSVRFNIGVNF